MHQLEAYARDPWSGTTFRVERSPAHHRAVKHAAILNDAQSGVPDLRAKNSKSDAPDSRHHLTPPPRGPPTPS